MQSAFRLFAGRGSNAMRKECSLCLGKSLGETVGYQVQLQAILEQLLGARQHKREPPGGGDRQVRHLVQAAA